MYFTVNVVVITKLREVLMEMTLLMKENDDYVI